MNENREKASYPFKTRKERNYFQVEHFHNTPPSSNPSVPQNKHDSITWLTLRLDLTGHFENYCRFNAYKTWRGSFVICMPTKSTDRLVKLQKMIYYWAASESNAQSRITIHLCRKNRNWRTELPGAFARPFMAPFNGANFASRGRPISCRLANRFGSRFVTNTKLLPEIIGPISTPNGYLNTVFGWYT